MPGGPPEFMMEAPRRTVIDEAEFARLLETQARPFFGLSHRVRRGASGDEARGRPRFYFDLSHQANEVESFLDDHGARYNRAFHVLTELIASLRGFARAGYSISHMLGRLASYRVEATLGSSLFVPFLESSQTALQFVETSIRALFAEIESELETAGIGCDGGSRSSGGDDVGLPRHLPRNVGVEEIADEDARIAEVASKYLLAEKMLADLRVQPIEGARDRGAFLARACTEEQARVYEATVHNLQSAYDTYIKNTRFELEDDRLPQLRGLTSAVLHLLEAVTLLTHFYERHESDLRSEIAKSRLAALVDRGQVQEVILHHLLHPAVTALSAGRDLADEVLARFTNAQELVVELPDELTLHARPAALIVGVVNHHGTPVELEVKGQKCNAASILELLLTVGSHPDEKRYVFRGDAHPLRDLRTLFEHDLGENGIQQLPPELGYLRGSS